ncbi:Zinc transporter ZIP9 [Liparis tanakae]|uniref:Zinc transporter ZIP9 n=1 Tax=Liparis tanakae TaxID=230148 RepID=A0A4Z2GIE8_9TELE|nr:Zinc transporter ZIP9 [Liparis tanakae]
MDGAWTVTLISVAMFVGCFVLGFIPLLLTLSERSLQLVSILGAGLLCGTALAITIPEGVSLLEESSRASSSSSDVPSGLNAIENNRNGSATEKGLTPQLLIGLPLTFGFTFMFAVDQIASRATHLPNTIGITATLGLVIHAAADGFAVGAAVATGRVTVQVTVFLAVILHKFGGSTENQLSATGVGMLFSAGTFLYVATVHVLPEISRTGQAEDPHQHHLGLLQSVTLILGLGLPTVLALGLHAD